MIKNPEMSVIVITPDCYQTVRRVVESLREQTVSSSLEILLICPAISSLEADPSDLNGFANVQFIEIGPMTSTSVARATGVHAANAPIVAFAEDHCFPDRLWAESLLRRHKEPWAGVGPIIRCANPGSVISWANLLIEYGEWLEPIADGVKSHIPGHNSSYKRSALLEYGADLAGWLEAESAMQWDMANRGHQFCIEPDAVAYHLNFSKLFPSLTLRFDGGRLFASNRTRSWSFAKRISFAMASPLIPLVRLRRLLSKAIYMNGAPALLRILPCTTLLLIADGVGEAVGYACGTGNAMARLSRSEFHRDRNRSARDLREAA